MQTVLNTKVYLFEKQFNNILHFIIIITIKYLDHIIRHVRYSVNRLTSTVVPAPISVVGTTIAQTRNIVKATMWSTDSRQLSPRIEAIRRKLQHHCKELTNVLYVNYFFQLKTNLLQKDGRNLN